MIIPAACVGSFLRRDSHTHTTLTVHCFEEIIGERAFEIEVTDAGNRWRAQLRRRPGIPTAMMPFYGASPAEAARRLIDWMRRAHERQVAAAPTTGRPG